jgi:hypothetical protein
MPSLNSPAALLDDSAGVRRALVDVRGGSAVDQET